MIYLLDTNTFIEAKNRYYRMTICLGFWDWLDQDSIMGKVSSIRMVADELQKSDDDLSKWSKSRQNFFLESNDQRTQQVYAEIARHVMKHPHYAEPYKSRFLNAADSWLIATAKTLGAIVVTQEVAVPEESRKVKIPNICNEFDVDYCNTFELLEAFGVKFTLSS